MSTNRNTIALAEELAKLNGSILHLSTRKELTQRYVETCHSINSKNQIHIEFKSNSPVMLNPKYVTTISEYVESLNVKVYDIHSNLRDRVYVYGYPKKPSSPVAVVKALQSVTTANSSGSAKPSSSADSTDFEKSEPLNPALKKVQFNGQTLLTPIVFVKSTDDKDNNNQKIEPSNTQAPSTISIATNNASRTLQMNDLVPVREITPTTYDSLMYLKSRLTNNETFSRLRRFLACYTLENSELNTRDLNLFNESESYLSLKTQLVNEGLPSDERVLRQLYMDFLTDRGFREDIVARDLLKLKQYHDNSQMIRSNQVKSNFKTYYYGESSGRVRYITEQGITHTAPGRSVPETCVVV